MKTILPKNFLLLSLVLITLSAFGQEQDTATNSKVSEVGIGLKNLNSFSLQYRWGNEKRLY